MIPRSLVPFDARPSTLEPTTRRRPSALDDRTLVPAGLQVVPLETKSNIPTNLPLGSIAERFVVPRDVKPEEFVIDDKLGLPPQPSELDERIAVPVGAARPIVVPPPPRVSEELVEKDIFLTGEVNFLADAITREERLRQNRWLTLALYAAVFGAEVIVILVLLLVPALFLRRPPTAEEQEIARNQMKIFLPPGSLDLNPPTPRVTPPPKVKVDPRILRQIAPPEPQPQPAPPVQPKPEPKELPSAPTPNTSRPDAIPAPTSSTPKTETPSGPAPKLEAPEAPKAQSNLVLPKNSSAGRAIEDSMRATKPQAPALGGGGPLPGGGIPGGGGRQGQAFGAMEMLTPTEGVDFRDYLARVYTSVKRNWYAVMPESVNLGDKGIVSLQFKIMRNGSVPQGEPVLKRTSQKEPLDRAAVSSIRASNPFEPLPPAFSGPYIELRFTYYYNLSPEQ